MLHTPSPTAIDPGWFSAYAAQANGPVHGTQMSVAAEAVRPGDYLPPQPCLSVSAWAQCGFRVGPLSKDVCLGLSAMPGRVVLFGPLGVLTSTAHGDVVTVVRPDPT